MPLVCVCSPKGGVGKTMLAANVAHALHRLGHRVVALDLDPQNALRLHFGLPLEVEEGFMAALRRRPDWRAAACRTASGVLVLPFGATDAGERVAIDRAVEQAPELLGDPLQAMLSERSCTVVVDTVPGASAALAAVLPRADVILVPLLADGGSVATLPEIESGRFIGRGTLGRILGARMRFVLNQVEPEGTLSAAAADGILRRLGPRLLGFIARDPAIAEALACQALVADHAPASRAAADLAGIADVLDAALAPAAAPAFPAAELMATR